MMQQEAEPAVADNCGMGPVKIQAAAAAVCPLETATYPVLEDEDKAAAAAAAAAGERSKAAEKKEQRGAKLIARFEEDYDEELQFASAANEGAMILYENKFEYTPGKQQIRKRCTLLQIENFQHSRSNCTDIVQLNRKAATATAAAAATATATARLRFSPRLPPWTFANCFPVQQIYASSGYKPVAVCSSNESGVLLLLLQAPSQQSSGRLVHCRFPSVVRLQEHERWLAAGALTAAEEAATATAAAAAAAAAAEAAVAPCLTKEVLSFRTSLQPMHQSKGAMALVCTRGEIFLLVAEGKQQHKQQHTLEQEGQHKQQQQQQQPQQQQQHQQHEWEQDRKQKAEDRQQQHQQQQEQQHEQQHEYACKAKTAPRLVACLLSSSKACSSIVSSSNTTESSSISSCCSKMENILEDLPRWPQSQEDAAAAPPLRCFFSAAADEQSQTLILFGGAAAALGGSNDVRAINPCSSSSSNSSDNNGSSSNTRNDIYSRNPNSGSNATAGINNTSSSNINNNNASSSSSSSKDSFLPASWETLDDLWIFCCRSRQWRQCPREQHQPKSVTFAAAAADAEGATAAAAAAADGLASYSLPRRRRILWAPALAGHSAAVYRGSMFVFGGYKQQPATATAAAATAAGRAWVPRPGRGVAVSDLWRYNIKQNAWSYERAAGRAPMPRYLHASAVIGSFLLIYGGQTAGGPLPLDEIMFAADIGALNQLSWTRVTLLEAPPQPQFFLGAAAAAAGAAATPADCCYCSAEEGIAADALFICGEGGSYLVALKEIEAAAAAADKAAATRECWGPLEQRRRTDESEATKQATKQLLLQQLLQQQRLLQQLLLQHETKQQAAAASLCLYSPWGLQSADAEGSQVRCKAAETAGETAAKAAAAAVAAWEESDPCSTAAQAAAELAAAAAATVAADGEEHVGRMQPQHSAVPKLHILATPMMASTERKHRAAACGAVGASLSPLLLLRQPRRELLFGTSPKPQLHAVAPLHAAATPLVFRPRHRAKHCTLRSREAPQAAAPNAAATAAAATAAAAAAADHKDEVEWRTSGKLQAERETQKTEIQQRGDKQLNDLFLPNVTETEQQQQHQELQQQQNRQREQQDEQEQQQQHACMPTDTSPPANSAAAAGATSLNYYQQQQQQQAPASWRAASDSAAAIRGSSASLSGLRWVPTCTAAETTATAAGGAAGAAGAAAGTAGAAAAAGAAASRRSVSVGSFTRVVLQNRDPSQAPLSSLTNTPPFCESAPVAPCTWRPQQASLHCSSSSSSCSSSSSISCSTGLHATSSICSIGVSSAEVSGGMGGVWLSVHPNNSSLSAAETTERSCCQVSPLSAPASQQASAVSGAPWSPAAVSGGPRGPPTTLAAAHASFGAVRSSSVNGLQALLWWTEAHASLQPHCSKEGAASTSEGRTQEDRASSSSSNNSNNNSTDNNNSSSSSNNNSSSSSSRSRSSSSRSGVADLGDEFQCHREAQRLAALMYSLQPARGPPVRRRPPLPPLPSPSASAAAAAAAATTTTAAATAAAAARNGDKDAAADSSANLSRETNIHPKQTLAINLQKKEGPPDALLPFPRPARKIKRANARYQTPTSSSSSSSSSNISSKKGTGKEGVSASGKRDESRSNKTTPRAARLDKPQRSLPSSSAAAAAAAPTATSAAAAEAKARRQQAAAALGCRSSSLNTRSKPSSSSNSRTSSNRSRTTRGSSSISNSSINSSTSSSKSVPLSSVLKTRAASQGPHRSAAAAYSRGAAGGGPPGGPQGAPNGAPSAFGRMWRRVAEWPPDAVAALLHAKETVQRHSRLFSS